MHGDQLALQMGRELGDLRGRAAAHDALDLVAIGFGLGRLLQVEQARVPGRDLHALVAERGRPAADRVERIERRLVAGELREEEAGPFMVFMGDSVSLVRGGFGRHSEGRKGTGAVIARPSLQGRRRFRTASSGSSGPWRCPS